jgi:hypothetical protein
VVIEIQYCTYKIPRGPSSNEGDRPMFYAVLTLMCLACTYVFCVCACVLLCACMVMCAHQWPRSKIGPFTHLTKLAFS